jgi:undecaprenyl-diphosphatase
MTIWTAIILGLVQGVCEFLPISSSGHLVLLQNMFGIEEGVLFFDTMLHVGTLVAVLVVFRKTIWDMLKHPFQKKVGLLLASTAVTTVFALLFGDYLERIFLGEFLGFEFLLTAVILLISERAADGNKTIPQLSYPGAAGIGVMQAIAILPAVSRSGSTIAGCRFLGLNKGEAAEFSFLLSVPAIAGSVVLQIGDVLDAGAGGAPWGYIAVGALAAGVSGYFAIRYMLRLIREKSLKGFAYYAAAVGALVLLDQFVFNVFFVNPF